MSHPAIAWHFPYPDNLFHFLNDGFVPVLHTLLDTGLRPAHVDRCAYVLHCSMIVCCATISNMLDVGSLLVDTPVMDPSADFPCLPSAGRSTNLLPSTAPSVFCPHLCLQRCVRTEPWVVSSWVRSIMPTCLCCQQRLTCHSLTINRQVELVAMRPDAYHQPWSFLMDHVTTQQSTLRQRNYHCFKKLVVGASFLLDLFDQGADRSAPPGGW